MNKKIIIKTWSAAVLILFASCDKFLSVDPQEYLSDEATIVDEGSARSAVRGIYDELRSNNYYGQEFHWLSLLSADNTVYVGSQIVRQQLTNHTVRADFAGIESAWNAIYSTINRANNVIDKVPDLPITADFTQATKDGFIGEAYFVRALAYFDLARTWGGVQLVLEPTTSPNDLPNVERSTLQGTYAQVLEDLNNAEALLPETTNRIRATKKTVWALKARYHLYQKEWDEAIDYATRIIDDTDNYELVRPYSAFYAGNASGTKESVFELYYDINNTNNQRYQWQPSTRGGVAWIKPSNPVNNEPGNIVELLIDPNIGGDRSALVELQTINNAPNWFGLLYYRDNSTDPAFIIRTAELYLIRAEALAERDASGDKDSLADLNAVRARANVPLLGITDVATKTDLLLAIENENRVEFALENHRWYDLVRTGRAQSVLNIASTNRLLLPIPYSQIQVDPNLKQNPGLD